MDAKADHKINIIIDVFSNIWKRRHAMVNLKLKKFDSVLDVSRHIKDNAGENDTQCKRIFDELIRLVF